MKKTLTVAQCEAIFNEANQAGLDAANKTKLSDYLIVETDVYGNPVPGSQTYTMQGSCGFAGVIVKPANCKFAKWMKENNVGHKDLYFGGMRYSIFQFNQCYEKKTDYAYAFSSVLSKHGIRSFVDSRLD